MKRRWDSVDFCFLIALLNGILKRRLIDENSDEEVMRL